MAEFARRAPASALRDTFPAVERTLGGIELAVRSQPELETGRTAGLVYDASRNLAFLIRDGLQFPGLTYSDFAAALVTAYSAPAECGPSSQPCPSRFPKFSLDPADPTNPRGDWLQPVYMPALLKGTALGTTMLTTDWLMKQYGFAVIADHTGRFEPLGSVPGGLPDMFTLSFARRDTNQQEIWTRLWIYAADFRWKITTDAVVFTTSKMGVDARRQVPDSSAPSGLRDVRTGMDPAAAAFAHSFTERYDDVARDSPQFARLTELAKAVALANWLRERGLPFDPVWRDEMRAGTPAGPERIHTLAIAREQRTTSTLRRGATTPAWSGSRENGRIGPARVRPRLEPSGVRNRTSRPIA
jgi:hypothetical protein